MPAGRRKMGEIDRKMKEYFSDRRRYADLWNGSVFEGRKNWRGMPR